MRVDDELVRPPSTPPPAAVLLELRAEAQAHQLQALHQLRAPAGSAGRPGRRAEGGVGGATIVTTAGGAVLPPSASSAAASTAAAATPSVPICPRWASSVWSRRPPSLARRFTLAGAAASPVAPRAAGRPLATVPPVPAVTEARVLVQAPAVALRVVVAGLRAGTGRPPALALTPVVALLRRPRGRGGVGAQVGGVSGHVHLEAAEFGRETLVHVEVVVGLALLLKYLVEHWGALPGSEAVGDGGGLPAQDHLARERRRVLFFLLLLILLHPGGQEQSSKELLPGGTIASVRGVRPEQAGSLLGCS